MKAQRWIAGFLFVLLTAGLGISGEPAPKGFLDCLAPAGGWHPYGGGLLHWWPKHCFPHCGGPDDYCRKSLPCVCWSAYPASVTSGAAEKCDPPC